MTLTPFQNEFSWSVSRDKIFKICRRKYFFHYYGSWGGWSLDADNRTRNIYVLKQLKSRFMWAGSKVHEAIAKILKSHQEAIPIDKEEMIENTLDEMRKEFQSSQSKMYYTHPKSCALFEHEYDMPVSNTEWKRVSNHVIECLQHFLSSDLYAQILHLNADDWLEIEEFTSFYKQGIKIYAVFDFAFRQENAIFIYDWKTGTDDQAPHRIQLGCYGLFAATKWEQNPDKIHLREFNLANKTLHGISLQEIDLEGIQKYLWESIEDMKNCLEDSQSNTAVEEKFSFCTDRTLCESCNYLKICPRFQTASA